jgi:hypothetical protein
VSDTTGRLVLKGVKKRQQRARADYGLLLSLGDGERPRKFSHRYSIRRNSKKAFPPSSQSGGAVLAD